MAAADISPSSREIQLRCLLCFNEFKNPRVLSCFHSFCEKCLGDYIVSNVRNESEKIICPACKEKCDPPNRKIPIEKWASSFFLDELIVSIMELVEGKEESSNFCVSCESKGDEVCAEVWCLDCGDKLCSNCQQYHKQNKVLKNHKTVPVEEMKAGENLKLNYNPHCSCDRGDSVNLLCVDHKQKICTVCATTTHRNCEELRDLEKTGKEFTEGNLTRNVMVDVGKIENNLEQFNINIKTSISTFHSDIDKCVQDINSICNDIKQQIETFQITFRKASKELCENMESKYDQNEEILHRFSTSVENAKKIFSILNRHGNPKQKYIAYDTVISQLHSHYTRLRTEIEGKQDVRVSLEVNKTFQELKAMLVSVGKIHTSSTPSISASNFIENMNGVLKAMATRTRVNDVVCAAQVPTEECSRRFFSIVSQKDITGGQACFTGGTALTNGHLIMADNYNSRLVEFDTRHKMVAEYKLDGIPFDVTSHGNIIYASVDRIKKHYIYKCRVDGGLSVVKRIKAPDMTAGLAVCADGRIVVGAVYTVHVLSKSGKPIHKITTSNCTYYVATSHSAMYYIDDFSVVCRDLKDYTEQYRHYFEYPGPKGICLGDKYCLYVSCFDNISQISPDGDRVMVVNTDVFFPSAVMYNPYTNVYVTMTYEEYIRDFVMLAFEVK